MLVAGDVGVVWAHPNLPLLTPTCELPAMLGFAMLTPTYASVAFIFAAASLTAATISG